MFPPLFFFFYLFYNKTHCWVQTESLLLSITLCYVSPFYFIPRILTLFLSSFGLYIENRITKSPPPRHLNATKAWTFWFKVTCIYVESKRVDLKWKKDWNFEEKKEKWKSGMICLKWIIFWDFGWLVSLCQRNKLFENDFSFLQGFWIL